MNNSNSGDSQRITSDSDGIVSLSDLSLSDLRPDAFNANKGTERGLDMIRASLEKLGAGRSIVLDKHGRIVAGNQTVKAAGLAGMDDVIVIQTDGRKIVAVQRTDIDLDSPEGRELALSDNRAGELGLSWDVEVLSELQAEGLDLSGLFSDDEIDALLGELDWTDGDPDGPESGGPVGETGGTTGGAPVILSVGPGGLGGGPQSVKTPTAAGGAGGAGSEEGPPAAPAPAPATDAPGGAPAQGTPALSPAAQERAQRPLGPQGPPPTAPNAMSVGAAPVEFKEFDETVAGDVKTRECPACGHRWAA